MAVFVVEFSYGLAPPFMELSAGKPQRNNEKSEGKPARNSEGPENMQRARKRALQKASRSDELESERNKKQRSERSELASERYKKQRATAQRSERPRPAIHGDLGRQVSTQ